MKISQQSNFDLVVPVILCGGSGARLWPLSRLGFPKQFLVLSDDGSHQSLFQKAVMRINALGDGDWSSHNALRFGPTLIVTNEEHRFLVLDQLRQLPDIRTRLLLEPIGRNTAPALSLAAFQSRNIVVDKDADDYDPILVISPSDNVISNQAAFIKALQDCVTLVKADKSKNTIAILGVTPTSPETAYGYIKCQGSAGINQEYIVEEFVEKPDKKTAESYLKDGNYLWNSGMFILYASTWLSALEKFCPDIYSTSKAAWSSRKIDQVGETTFVRLNYDIFKLVPIESIDYAVIEKCPASYFQVRAVELNAGWNDLGSWDAVWKSGKQDTDCNLITGDVVLRDTKNSLIRSSSRLVSVVGVEGLIIVETADAVLVANKKNSQDVKHIVDQLDNQQREEKNLHRKIIRPWGWYDSIDQGDRFKVKRIQVNPGASLSLQMHHRRAEHWVVVRGIAEIINGDQVIRLIENQSTYIPKGQTHRLSNPGDEPLEIIEVQSGDYLGEDDIVRFEDNYDRN